VPVKDEVDVARIDLEPPVSRHLVEAIYDAIKPELKVEIERQFRLSGIARGSETLRYTLRRLRDLFASPRYPFKHKPIESDNCSLHTRTANTSACLVDKNASERVPDQVKLPSSRPNRGLGTFT
jgi:hypothetical protein